MDVPGRGRGRGRGWGIAHRAHRAEVIMMASISFHLLLITYILPLSALCFLFLSLYLCLFLCLSLTCIANQYFYFFFCANCFSIPAIWQFSVWAWVVCAFPLSLSLCLLFPSLSSSFFLPFLALCFPLYSALTWHCFVQLSCHLTLMTRHNPSNISFFFDSFKRRIKFAFAWQFKAGHTWRMRNLRRIEQLLAVYSAVSPSSYLPLSHTHTQQQQHAFL